MEPLVKALLFSEEAPLTGEVKGTSTFAADFVKGGPRDSAGRSLREFDLKVRMFKYPMSYLIYSDAIDELPAEARDQLYRRLHDVLTGKDEAKEFAHLSPADRKAVLEILVGTKQGLPGWFNAD